MSKRRNLCCSDPFNLIVYFSHRWGCSGFILGYHLWGWGSSLTVAEAIGTNEFTKGTNEFSRWEKKGTWNEMLRDIMLKTSFPRMSIFFWSILQCPCNAAAFGKLPMESSSFWWSLIFKPGTLLYSTLLNHVRLENHSLYFPVILHLFGNLP